MSKTDVNAYERICADNKVTSGIDHDRYDADPAYRQFIDRRVDVWCSTIASARGIDIKIEIAKIRSELSKFDIVNRRRPISSGSERVRDIDELRHFKHIKTVDDDVER
ncbi:MAG: hypothetical protein K5877_10485 [Lachnospiraceae bacterium]|nr:hypothetical protein [Lachnospiraceae bacterium]